MQTNMSDTAGPRNPSVRIFVSHRIDRESRVLEGGLYVPVRCGAAFDHREGVHLAGDDTGDNISLRKNQYSELTVQYWAWKNAQADYFGLCHYRRYFSFTNTVMRADDQGTVNFRSMDTCIRRAELLNEDRARKEILPYDIVLTTPFDVRRHGCLNLYEQFERAQLGMKREYLEKAVELLRQMYPDYAVSVDEYLNGTLLYPCCMFIMKRKWFLAYCEWLFPMLFELEKQADGQWPQRTVGHVAERLLGVFVLEMKKREHCKTHVLQRCLVLDDMSAWQYIARMLKSEWINIKAHMPGRLLQMKHANQNDRISI